MLSGRPSELAHAAAPLPLTIEGQRTLISVHAIEKNNIARLLTAAECAKRLSVSDSWVRRHPDVLRPIRLDGNVRYDVDLIEALCTSPTSPAIVTNAGITLKPERTSMLQRWQRGTVYSYRGKRVKTWYGVYRIDKQDADGKIVRRQKVVRLGDPTELPTISAARNKLRILLQAVQQKPTTSMRFVELVERWQSAVAITIHESTRAYYQKMLKAHLTPAFGDRDIQDLTKYELEMFFSKKAKSFSRSTLKGMRIALSRVLGWAYDNDWLSKNPVRGIQLPRTCGGRRTERHVLSGEQVLALSHNLHQPFGTLVLFLAVTGVRIAEATNATWSDVIDGKLHVRGTKSAAARRAIPLPDGLIDGLRKLGTEGLLFKSQSGTALNSGNMLKRYIRPACQKLGIKLGGLHDFRHTAVTKLLRNGCDVKIVSFYAGHSSTRVTLDVYRHTNTEELRGPVGQLLENVMKSEATA